MFKVCIDLEKYFVKIKLILDQSTFATKLISGSVFFNCSIIITSVAGGDNCQPLIKNCNDQRNVNSIANIGYKGKYRG